jgi:lipopolysaccharide export system protein LptA
MRTALLLGCILVLAAPGLSAPPGGDSPGALEVEGATYAELDEATGLLTLRGRPVTVRRGALILRAPSIVYDTKRRILRASGGVSYADASQTVDASELTVWMDDDRLEATGGVTASRGQGADALRLRAARLDVFNRDRRAVAAGAVELRSPEGTITADRVEAALAGDELTAEGNVRLLREDIEGRAPRLLVRRREGIAVLSGGAVVRQGPHEARAEMITVDLRRRRFTAEGHARLVLSSGR